MTRFFKKYLFVLLAVSLSGIYSCNRSTVCAGLHSQTGTFNNGKRARKGYRGTGYKSPKELESRDRQRKRLKKKGNRSKRMAHGVRNGSGGK